MNFNLFQISHFQYFLSFVGLEHKVFKYDLGSCHADELVSIFEPTAIPIKAGPFTGDENEKLVSNNIMTLWINFAKNGNPSRDTDVVQWER